jgi:hypothetical protein
MDEHEDPTTSMNYVARRSCGCCVLAIADRPEYKKDIASSIAEAIQRGNTIERVTTQWIRTESAWGCDECKPPPAAKQEPFL